MVTSCINNGLELLGDGRGSEGAKGSFSVRVSNGCDSSVDESTNLKFVLFGGI